jgi:Domain of unknown function (DUF3854)
MILAEHHEKMLIEESSIDPKVVEARGYRTVETKSELRRLGYSDSQCNKPGLLIPVYSPTGDIATYQYRPDKPRIDKKGKPVKYETPSGTRMVLDIHPFAREMLGNPSIPLFITEGLKKSDALVSRGLCTVTLLGVWSWRGRNGDGGLTALTEWEYIGLNGREVYIVFDSDIMLKLGVYRAMVRLMAFLEGRGADVRIIYLPPGEGAKKQGVDDFFVAGNTKDGLLSFATTELKEPPEGEEFAEEPNTQAATLVIYAEDAELFRTPDGEAYVTFPVEES